MRGRHSTVDDEVSLRKAEKKLVWVDEPRIRAVWNRRQADIESVLAFYSSTNVKGGGAK